MHPLNHAFTLTLLTATLAIGCGDDEAVFADDSSGGAGTGGQAAGGESQGGGATGGSGTGGAATGGDGTGGTPACMDLGDPCTQCEAQACPQEYCDCFNNGACGLLAGCIALCAPNDAACIQTCGTTYPDGISDGALLTHCAATTCANDCPGYLPLTDCQLCLYTDCQPEMNECISNPDCTQLLFCLDACSTPGCEQQCYTAYPNGLSDAGPVGECLQDNCVADCG